MKTAKKKPGKVDVMFADGPDNFRLAIVMQKGTLIYQSPFEKNSKGVAFDSPETMELVAKYLDAFAKQWKESLQPAGESNHG
jgi:hypothetical protein